jgi:hypothetical protein
MSTESSANGKPDSAAGSSASSDNDLSDLECLDFAVDVDWSSTLVLRCDPAGCPYNLSDVVHALYDVVRRTEVFNLGPTFLNHAFTLGFKSERATEGFVKFMQSPKMAKGLKVKGKTCSISRVPTKCVTIHVRNIPLEVDSAHVISTLKPYGQVVKTELVRNNFRGWFNVYTNERKFTFLLKEGVKIADLPFGLEVKGMYASVYVAERNPKCLECYYSGHKGDTCELSGCILYKK